MYPSLLEKVTGIGRQTWKRRASEFLKSLNTPIIEGRKLDLEENEEIDHINIELIDERYGHNPKQLINHLYHLKESRIKLYSMIKDLKTEKASLLKTNNEFEKLLEDNKRLKAALAHFYQLSNNLAVSSYFPELRKKLGAKENVFDISSNPEVNTDISNLNNLFPSSKEMSEAKNTIDKLLESDSKKVGEELFNEIKNEFGDIIDD